MSNIESNNLILKGGEHPSSLSGNNALYGSKLVGGKKSTNKSTKRKTTKKTSSKKSTNKSTNKSTKRKTAKKSCWWNIFKK